MVGVIKSMRYYELIEIKCSRDRYLQISMEKLGGKLQNILVAWIGLNKQKNKYNYRAYIYMEESEKENGLE